MIKLFKIIKIQKAIFFRFRKSFFIKKSTKNLIYIDRKIFKKKKTVRRIENAINLEVKFLICVTKLYKSLKIKKKKKQNIKQNKISVEIITKF